MSAGGSNKAVMAALGANLGVAVSKFVAFAFTGSASMLAEGVHSVADSGNQLLLLVGGRQARKKADAEHPFGYGRERFVYAFIVSVVLFSLGGLFALYEGWHKVTHPEKVESWYWAVGVLVGVAIVLAVEMKSLLVGEGAGKHDVSAIRAAAVDGHTVTDVIHLRTMYLGPEELLVAMKIAVQHDDTAEEVAKAIDAAEARIRTAVPEARLVYLEPDVRRPGPLPQPTTG